MVPWPRIFRDIFDIFDIYWIDFSILGVQLSRSGGIIFCIFFIFLFCILYLYFYFYFFCLSLCVLLIIKCVTLSMLPGADNGE